MRIDRKRKLPVTVLLKALGMGGPRRSRRFEDSWLVRNTLERDDTFQGGACLRSSASAPGRAGQHRERRTWWTGCSSTPSVTTSLRWGYKVDKKLKLKVSLDTHTLTIEDIEAL